MAEPVALPESNHLGSASHDLREYRRGCSYLIEGNTIGMPKVLLEVMIDQIIPEPRDQGFPMFRWWSILVAYLERAEPEETNIQNNTNTMAQF
jgi:hypothetical protein